MEKAIVAGGCFWCIEAVFNQIKGVKLALSGYIGGQRANPTYEQVCSGATGHTEAVEIEYDPDVISYEKLLEIFFAIHDPTQLNRQGNDTGTQYRGGIYYLDDEQRQIAESVVAELQPHYDAKIVTEILPAKEFYPAETYHQNYFKQNPNTGYCNIVVAPKYLKAKTNFAEYWKE